LVKARDLSDKLSFGIHGKRKRGLGNVFWQFKNYQHGDELKLINWKKSAKADEIFVRENELEMAQTFYFYIDTSLSMSYALNEKLLTKGDYATILTLALSIILINAEEKIIFLNTLERKTMTLATIEQLEPSLTANNFNLINLEENILSLKNHSVLIIASDFLDDITKIRHILELAEEKNIKVLFLAIYDHAEIYFPFKNRILLNFLEEDNEQLFEKAKTVKEIYLKRFTEHQQQIKDLCFKHNAKHFSTINSQDPVDILANVLNYLTSYTHD